jgi:hypothetical protein
MQILDWHRGRELAQLSEESTLRYMEQHAERFKRLIPNTTR